MNIRYRLFEWGVIKTMIIAVDFDGTLCEDKWPDIGKPNEDLLNNLVTLRREGHKVILWTCRVGERLEEAIRWCKNHALEFDAVNENLPEVLEWMKTDSRKIYADLYIDDKALQRSYDISKIFNEYPLTNTSTM